MDEVSSYVRLDPPSLDGKAAQKIVPPRLRIPWWKGLGADSEEKREPASDINTRVVESLKVLDTNRPIREADIDQPCPDVRFVPLAEVAGLHSSNSSARISKDNGTSIPSVLATRRLMRK